MKQHRLKPRTAIALLLAGIALPLTPALAQVAPTASPPLVNAPPPTLAPAPPPTVYAPPPPTSVAPAPRVQAPAPPPPRIATPAADPAPARAAPTRATQTQAARSEARPAARRVRAPVRPAPAESAPVAEAAPVAEPLAPLAAPTAALPPAMAPVSGEFVAPESEASGTGAMPLWLLGAAALAIAAFAAFALSRRRRRTDDVVYEEEVLEQPYQPERNVAPSPAFSAPAAFAAAVPLAAAAPLTAAAPVAAYDVDGIEQPSEHETSSADRISVGEPDPADVEALAASSTAPDGRPWIEFMLRPLRAGTTSDDTIVEFELTVGNTGSVPAKDVRISTWMFAAGSAADTEMERMLIDRPDDAQHSEMSIPAGDGARVEAALGLRKTGNDETVLPVVVADARYTLPDGSEGRTSASFEIGMAGDETLTPFPTDRSSGLLESVEARLHGDLERT